MALARSIFLALILCIALPVHAAEELISETIVAGSTSPITVPNVAIPADCDPCTIIVSFGVEADVARSIGTATWNSVTLTEGTLYQAGSGPINSTHQAWLFDADPGVTSDLTVTFSTPIDEASVHVSVWKGLASGTPESNEGSGAQSRFYYDSVVSTEGSLVVAIVSEGLGIAAARQKFAKGMTALTGTETIGGRSVRVGWKRGSAGASTRIGWGSSNGSAPRLAFSSVVFDVASPTLEAPLDLGDPTDDVPITDHGWVDMAATYGLLCDGSDEIAKYVTAIDDNSNSTSKALFGAALFLPVGDCAVSDTINFRRTDDTWLHQASIIGRGRTQTTIRLLDGSTGFDDPNAATKKAVVQANSRFTPNVGDPAWNISGGGNEAFNNYLYNLKIDTGDNNAGASGADWHISNTGAIRNVDIVAGAQGGYAGIVNRRELAGPGLVVDSTISGAFRYGYEHSQPQYAMTFDRVSTSGMTIAGYRIADAALCVRDATHTGPSPIVNGATSFGLTALIDSTATGGAGGNAMTGTGTFFVRNFDSDGYNTQIGNINGINNEAVTPSISEYHSRPVESAFNLFSQNSINLSSPPPPTMFTTDNPDAWVNAYYYGTSQGGGSDDSIAFANASAEGYPYIYVTANNGGTGGYGLDTTWDIPATVQTVDFMLAGVSLDGGDPSIRVSEDSVTPLTIWRMRGSTNDPVSTVIEITAQRPVVLKDVNVGARGAIVIGPGAGPVWLENVFAGRLAVETGAVVHASQLNVERNIWDNIPYDPLDPNVPTYSPIRSPRVFNFGATLDVFCAKTESSRPWSYTDAGTTEVLGGFYYPVSSFPALSPGELPAAANEVKEGSGWFTYIEEGVIDTSRAYPVHLRETRNEITREILKADLPTRGGGGLGHHATALSAHVTSSVTINPELTFTNADSSTWNVVQIDPDGENGIVLDPGIWSQPVDCTPYARVAMAVEQVDGNVDIDLYTCNDIGGPPIGSFDPADPSTLAIPHECVNLTPNIIVDGVGTAEGTTDRFYFSGHLGQLVVRTEECDGLCSAIISLSCSGSNAIAEFEGDALSVRDASKALGDAVNEAIEDGMTVEIQITVPASRTTKFKTLQELGTVKVYRPDYNSNRDGPVLEP